MYLVSGILLILLCRFSPVPWSCFMTLCLLLDLILNPVHYNSIKQWIMQLYTCINSALIFSMHISHLLHHGLGANDRKISLQAWLYTTWLFPLNLWKLFAAGNIKHLTGKCLQVWDLSRLTNEGGTKKWWERAEGRWGTISFPPAQRTHAEAQVWKMNEPLASLWCWNT